MYAGRAVHEKPTGHYLRLFLMIVLSFLAMCALMYAMVNTFGNVYSSLNQVYMAGLMTAAMLLIELPFMGGMYPNRRLNAMLLAAGAAALRLFWMATGGRRRFPTSNSSSCARGRGSRTQASRSSANSPRSTG